MWARATSSPATARRCSKSRSRARPRWSTSTRRKRSSASKPQSRARSRNERPNAIAADFILPYLIASKPNNVNTIKHLNVASCCMLAHLTRAKRRHIVVPMLSQHRHVPPVVTVRASLAGLDQGEFTEGHELPGKWKVAKEMIGRRLSQEEAKRLLAKFGSSSLENTFGARADNICSF